MGKKQKLFFANVLFFFVAIYAFSQTTTVPSAVAMRTDGTNIFYYASLHEAIDSANLLPATYYLLSDVELHAPLVISDNQHITLIPNGNRIIMRANDFLDYPLIWIIGENASLTLGVPDMNHVLTIDGGYPQVEAHSPLITLNGLDSKLIMYDNVILQNNHNTGSVPDDKNYYNYGAGVYVRTTKDAFDRPVEFIMKGGIIRGNINEIQHSKPYGGGVNVISGIFTMEGGEIMNNSVSRTGGGVYISNRASFRKTAGTIYGENAPIGYRNTALGLNSPKPFGHAISVGGLEMPIFRFRDDTIKNDDSLSYTASYTSLGTFGKGEKWHDQYTMLRRYVLIGLMVLSIISGAVLIFLRKKRPAKKQSIQKEKSQAQIEAEALLTDREKDVLNLFLAGETARQIAQNLNCSISNINKRSESIYRKLNVNSREEILVKFKG